MLIPISDKFTQRANGPMKEYSVSVGSCFSDVFQKILFLTELWFFYVIPENQPHLQYALAKLI